MNIDNIEQARDLAKKMGLRVHHKSSMPTIIKQIMEAQKAPIAKPMEHKAEKAVTPEITNTEEQVLEAIKPYLTVDGFTAQFLSDNTWVFKRGKAEDSGNMSIPLRVIRMKAENVSRGTRQLRGFKDSDGIVMMAN